MINFREPAFVVPSALMVLSIVVLAATLLFMVFVPAPSVAGLARGRAAHLQQMTRETADAKARVALTRQQIQSRVWTGSPDTISGTVLEQLTAQARQRGLALSAFRPQRTQTLGGVTELPFTVQMAGSYSGVQAVMASLDDPHSKVVLRSAQIAASPNTTGVTATLGLSAYVVSDPDIAAPLPAKNTKTKATKTNAKGAAHG